MDILKYQNTFKSLIMLEYSFLILFITFLNICLTNTIFITNTIYL